MKAATALVLALILLASAGCDTQEAQNEFLDQAAAPPRGYTATDADGNVLERDEDDWRTAPTFIGDVSVSPAFPNPVTDGFVTIPFNVSQFDRIVGGLELYARDGSGRLVRLDEVLEANVPGSYIFSFSPGLIGDDGLQRVFISDGQGLLVSYGDIFIR
jgi:hypothetical protein